MRFIVNAATDVGITKNVNQDSLTLRIGTCCEKNIAMVILCDGMGGLQRGEVASAKTVNKFKEWSDRRLPIIISEENLFDAIKRDWDQLVNELNDELYTYGQSNRENLGTTLSGILIIDNQYLIINVGDSRVYGLDKSITQITEDQSVVAREIKMGRLTPEQAKVDPRRNVLLYCIGATKDLEIEYYTGNIESGQGFLICSDGLRHMVTEEELFQYLNPINMNTEENIAEGLNQLIKLNIERKETDNITAAFVKVV